MATEGPGAVQDRGLHLGVTDEHLADGREGRVGQTDGLAASWLGAGCHDAFWHKALKRFRKAANSGA